MMNQDVSGFGGAQLNIGWIVNSTSQSIMRLKRAFASLVSPFIRLETQRFRVILLTALLGRS